MTAATRFSSRPSLLQSLTDGIGYLACLHTPVSYPNLAQTWPGIPPQHQPESGKPAGKDRHNFNGKYLGPLQQAALPGFGLE
jgi:hypothetical protein